MATDTNGGSVYQFDNFRVLTEAVEESADYNENDIVNAGDLDEWKAAFGATHAADGDGDGDADGKDFLTWQRQFGTAGQVAAGNPVPEPSALLLGFLALVPLVRRRLIG